MEPSGRDLVLDLLCGTLQLWFTVLERYHHTSCTVSNLIVGNSYAFRVFAENQCGLSETASTTTDLAHIQKAGKEDPEAMTWEHMETKR